MRDFFVRCQTDVLMMIIIIIVIIRYDMIEEFNVDSKAEYTA